MMHWRFSLIRLISLSFAEQLGDSEFSCLGGDVDSEPGEKAFTAFSTSRFISVSSEVLPGGIEAAGTEFEVALGIAFGAAFLVAWLFRSSSKSLHRVVRISTVSLRSFFSVASLFISNLQASRSTRIFSFSNSSGVRANVATRTSMRHCLP